MCLMRTLTTVSVSLRRRGIIAPARAGSVNVALHFLVRLRSVVSISANNSALTEGDSYATAANDGEYHRDESGAGRHAGLGAAGAGWRAFVPQRRRGDPVPSAYPKRSPACGAPLLDHA